MGYGKKLLLMADRLLEAGELGDETERRNGKVRSGIYLPELHKEQNAFVYNIIKGNVTIWKQFLLEILVKKIPLIRCSKWKQNFCKENYDDGCIRKARSGVMCVKAGILKLNAFGSGSGRGRCPLCYE
jgi:hypothetical protein